MLVKSRLSLRRPSVKSVNMSKPLPPPGPPCGAVVSFQPSKTSHVRTLQNRPKMARILFTLFCQYGIGRVSPELARTRARASATAAPAPTDAPRGALHARPPVKFRQITATHRAPCQNPSNSGVPSGPCQIPSNSVKTRTPLGPLLPPPDRAAVVSTPRKR